MKSKLKHKCTVYKVQTMWTVADKHCGEMYYTTSWRSAVSVALRHFKTEMEAGTRRVLTAWNTRKR